jgi:hypothetical protein
VNPWRFASRFCECFLFIMNYCEANMGGRDRTFSWTDLAIICGSFLSCLSLIIWLRECERAKPLYLRDWPGDSHNGEIVAGSLCFGLALAGPFVLAHQAFVRKKWLSFSLGEWLWIVPLVLYMGVDGSSRVPYFASGRANLLVAITYLFLQGFSSLAAVIALVIPRSGIKLTDRLGCVSCLMVGLFWAYVFLGELIASAGMGSIVPILYRSLSRWLAG